MKANWKLLFSRLLIVCITPLTIIYNFAVYLPCMAFKFTIANDFNSRFQNFYYTEKHNLKARFLSWKRAWNYYKESDDE